MAYGQFWMIVNTDDAFDAVGGEKIPEKQAPRFLHPTREQAENVLLRLAAKWPHTEFVLMESVARVRRVNTVVCSIDTIEEIPF